MQYTPHYNLNLPEGTDIVNPLIQDNPNYTAIDTALYNNKLRVVGTATHVKTGTNHAITLGDSDINQFKFVATGDYATGDTFTVDGVTVTARIASGASIPSGAFKINSTVVCVLDGTILNLINIDGSVDAGDVFYDNTSSGLSASRVQGAIDELANPGSISTTADGVKTWAQVLAEIYQNITGTVTPKSKLVIGSNVYHVSLLSPGTYSFINETMSGGSGLMTFRRAYLSSPSSYIINSEGTYDNETNNVCPSGTKITLYY